MGTNCRTCDTEVEQAEIWGSKFWENTLTVNKHGLYWSEKGVKSMLIRTCYCILHHKYYILQTVKMAIGD